MITGRKRRPCVVTSMGLAILMVLGSSAFPLQPSAEERWDSIPLLEAVTGGRPGGESEEHLAIEGEDTRYSICQGEEVSSVPQQDDLDAARLQEALEVLIATHNAKNSTKDREGLEACRSSLSEGEDAYSEELSEEAEGWQDYWYEDWSTEETADERVSFGEASEGDTGRELEETYTSPAASEPEDTLPAYEEAAPTAPSQEAEQESASSQGAQETTASSYSDLDLLCAICSIEAGGSYEGALAVANVVLNRLKCGFADTIYGVIYAPYQFDTSNMDYYLQNGSSEHIRRAAQDALSGINNVGDYLYFNGVYWLDPDSLDVPHVVIGGNCFY